MSHIEENKQDIFFSSFHDIFEIFIMSDLQTEYRYITVNREMFLYLCYEILMLLSAIYYSVIDMTNANFVWFICIEVNDQKFVHSIHNECNCCFIYS